MTDSDRTGVCAPKGFLATGIAGGIKPAGKLDVALVFSKTPAVAAGVFTTNIVKAASVQLSIKNLANQQAQAVIITSGNANAANGKSGYAAVVEMTAVVAKELEIPADDVLIAQTGLIGFPFNTEAGVIAARTSTASLNDTSGFLAAQAIMTTDTVPKIFTKTFSIDGCSVTVGAMAKGAAMLAPAMATMIAVITTDADISAEVAQKALSDAMPDSFHSIVVDGCRSTNDTVLLLANAASAAPRIDKPSDKNYEVFAARIREAAHSLAFQMINDAEGATKLLEMNVVGASSEAHARLAARGVVSSNLVKCSLTGEDPYWGRILSELGASGAQFDPDCVEIAYGDYVVCKDGTGCSHDQAGVRAYMKNREIKVTASIGTGPGRARAYGCDLTHAYIDENIRTS